MRALLRTLLPRVIRNWLRSPSQTLAWARDELGHHLGRHPVISVHPGWSLRIHPAARRAFAIPQADPSQVAELDSFISACCPEMVLFDVGAHFGLFSLAALRYGGPTARVVAVEASASAVRILRLHARLNHASERLQVVHAAAAERPGWHNMLPVGVIADGYYMEPEPGRLRSDLVRVRAVSVDSLATELGLAPTHLKIDVEGGEASVIRGAESTLGGERPPRVFLELHNTICRRAGADPGECLTRLKEMGYRFRSSGGAPLSVEQATQPPLIRLVAQRGDH